MNEPLTFNIAMGRSKPENIRHREVACPFCAVDELTNILDTEGDIIWLMNKYPVLDRTWPTVIIETHDCFSEFSRYSPEQAEKVLEFSLRKWRETMARKDFKSVLYFKNFGPMSGGSIRHPHSQIIGLYDYDYRQDIKEAHFEGLTLKEEDNLLITLSDKPIIGFFEFNMKFNKDTSLALLSRRIQQVLRYILTDFSKHSGSYNLFFYDLHTSSQYVKIVPRYITSPLYVGYTISQISNKERIEQVKQELNQDFFK
ncbi:DUF4931 domain-containing protein [Veillonella sp. R32]|uniref:DUF4931 domain-containing protein n=1 Tax=Veillonella sp. R32 TaxID=2021312 RepID=UPI001389F635|nr:DUF4931 domain-containing protein [Veillonella sp. R32]KAF1680459.1 DUF4931 domain-containing protein [Veillonella sp. R32]